MAGEEEVFTTLAADAPAAPPPAAPGGSEEEVFTTLAGDDDGTSPPPPYIPFEVALSAFLAANVGLPAWHAVIPEKARLPAVAWQEVDGDSGNNLAGPDGSTRRNVQIAVYDFNLSPAACWSWGEAIRAALVGSHGKAVFQGVFAHAIRSGSDPGSDGSGRSTHSHLREYLFVYHEPRA